MNENVRVRFGRHKVLFDVLSSNERVRGLAISELLKTKEGRDMLEIIIRIMKAELQKAHQSEN